MSDEADYDSSHLLQFIYSCPVGLVDMDAEGSIGLVNPVAMQTL